MLYGVVSILWILGSPPAMSACRRSPPPSRQGAKAYLNRQYTTIAIVGVVLFVVLGFALDWAHRRRLRRRRDPVGLAGYIGMNVSVRANVRTAEAAKHGLNAALQVAFRGGAITGMLVVGLGLLGVAGYFACWAASVMTGGTPRRHCTRWSAWPSAAR